jgi:hypothetical protein
MAKEIVEQFLVEEVAKKKFPDCRVSGEVHYGDLTVERHAYLSSGGHISPQNSPVQPILRCDHTLFGV